VLLTEVGGQVTHFEPASSSVRKCFEPEAYWARKLLSIIFSLRSLHASLLMTSFLAGTSGSSSDYWPVIWFGQPRAETVVNVTSSVMKIAC
jgi:hypothetical protein